MLLSLRVFINSPLKIYGCRRIQTYENNNKPSTIKSTLDQKDVDFHTDQTSGWWNPEGPLKGLHSFNVLRVPYIRDGLVKCDQIKTDKPLKNKKILDVGCGGGLLSEPLALLGANVTGLDASYDLIETARWHGEKNMELQGNMPQYVCSTIEDHAAENEEYYDGVVASEIIEHVNNKELFVKSCVKTLKPGGRIFFTTPTRTRLSHFAMIFLGEYVIKTIPKGTHQYEKFMTPAELSFLIERNNCKVETTTGLLHNFMTNTWHWSENYYSFMFAMQAVKCGESNEK